VAVTLLKRISKQLRGRPGTLSRNAVAERSKSIAFDRPQASSHKYVSLDRDRRSRLLVCATVPGLLLLSLTCRLAASPTLLRAIDRSATASHNPVDRKETQAAVATAVKTVTRLTSSAATPLDVTVEHTWLQRQSRSIRQISVLCQSGGKNYQVRINDANRAVYAINRVAPVPSDNAAEVAPPSSAVRLSDNTALQRAQHYLSLTGTDTSRWIVTKVALGSDTCTDQSKWEIMYGDAAGQNSKIELDVDASDGSLNAYWNPTTLQ